MAIAVRRATVELAFTADASLLQSEFFKNQRFVGGTRDPTPVIRAASDRYNQPRGGDAVGTARAVDQATPRGRRRAVVPWRHDIRNRLSELAAAREIGESFDALKSLMSGGDPPVQRFDEGEADRAPPARWRTASS